MSSVELRAVAADEAELRLDRWFRRHFPALSHGRLQKLLRTGQIRLDGQRVEANARLAHGQTIRVPPQAVLGGQDRATPPPARRSPADALRLEEMILFQDETLLVLNKPSGLAVQGGTGTSRHLDGMLAAWGAKERPRLVHRLDRDTSGLLVVARTATAAARLTQAFRRHQVDKLYWALVAGRPPAGRGIVDRPLAKQPGVRGERVEPDEEGRSARTAYRMVARAGKVASWLALRPLTGRTHQLRAHCTLLGTPIVGDFKYGGAAARLAGAPKGLMLHARELRLPHPKGGTLAFTAPLSPEIEAGFAWLGFAPDRGLAGATLAGFDSP